MEALAFYLLKVHISISILYAIYYLTVKKELFFKLNRFVLLGIIILAFSLPLLPSLNINIGPLFSQGRFQTVLNETHNSPNGLVKGKEVSRLADEVNIKRLSAVIISLMVFYLLVVVISLLGFIDQVSNVLKTIRASDKVNDNDAVYRDPGEECASFSFFNSILINKEQYSAEQFRQVLIHEKAHVNQLHSIDILLAELAFILLCANPIAKALKNAVRLNLEFLADKEVLDKGFDKKMYQWNILRPYLNQQTYPLTNLYSSKPKQRIERMNARKSSFFNLIKYVILIPVIAFIYWGIIPFHSATLDRIFTMKLIEKHEFRDYLGFYEFKYDKGTFIQILMKDETLVMSTLWNNKKLYFTKISENTFINKEAAIPLTFPKNRDGRVTELVAFGDDRWKKVKEYKPVLKKASEGTVISRTSSGGMQVLVYAVEPWANVKNYTTENAVYRP